MRKSILYFLLLTNLWAYSQDFALKKLENSSRHHEWVEVKYDNRVVHCFVTYPEISEKALSVIVLHENRGLTDWVRAFTDGLAEKGYIAIAPDLLSEFDEGYNKTSDFKSSDDARNAIYKLDGDQVTRDLDAVYKYVSNLPASNGKVAIAGFCWGGAQTFRYATNNKQLVAALVFYGSAPDKKEDVKRISAPVYGFYGENDERINAGVPAIEQLMKAEGKTYKYEIYKGAGHAYMRRGEDPEGSKDNKKAAKDSWVRIIKILKSH